MINLFFGWTLIGWVVSMAIAVGDRHPHRGGLMHSRELEHVEASLDADQ